MSKKIRNKNANSTKVQDGFVNVAANINTSRDKSFYAKYVNTKYTNDDFKKCFEESWLGNTIVTMPAEDSTRAWRRWDIDSDEQNLIRNLEIKLQLKSKVFEAMVYSRLYGVGYIYIHSPGDLEDPIDKHSEILSLVVIDPNLLKEGDVITNIEDPYFGKCCHYILSDKKNHREIKIHNSRFAVLSQPFKQSVLRTCLDPIKMVDSVFANASSLVYEAKIDVFRFAGLAQMLDSGKDGDIIRRMNTQALIKSNNGAIVLDKEDEYDSKTAEFSSLSNLIDKLIEFVSGASRIPVTRLVGAISTGLSNSNQGDLSVYYERIHYQQSSMIQPALSNLDHMIINQALGGGEDLHLEVSYSWISLERPNDKENSEIFHNLSTGVASLANSGVFDPSNLKDPVEALFNKYNLLNFES